MAVPAVPFWLSQAQDEFKKPRPGWMTETLDAAKIPAPRWCSELAGKSAETRINMMVKVFDIAQGDVHYGAQVGGGGWFDPPNYNGSKIMGLYATNYDNNLYIQFSIAVPATTLTIDGLGTFSFSGATSPVAIGVNNAAYRNFMNSKNGYYVTLRFK